LKTGNYHSLSKNASPPLIAELKTFQQRQLILLAGTLSVIRWWSVKDMMEGWREKSPKDIILNSKLKWETHNLLQKLKIEN